MPAPPNGPFVVTSVGTSTMSRAETRSASFRSPSRSLRVPAALPDDILTRCTAQALVNRPDAVFWGPTAALLQDLPVPYRLEGVDLPVLVPEGSARPRRAGVVPRQADIVPSEIRTVGELRVTSPARTFMDVASMVSLPDLVAVGDVVLRDHHTVREELIRVLDRRLRYPGKVRARAAIELLSALSRSPQESRLRAHMVLDGLPAPEVNAVITDALGGFLACCDLVYRRWRIVIEYDGEVHDEPGRRRIDATRRTLLREHGWYVVEINADDLRHPSRALGKIHAAIRVMRTD